MSFLEYFRRPAEEERQQIGDEIARLRDAEDTCVHPPTVNDYRKIRRKLERRLARKPGRLEQILTTTKKVVKTAVASATVGLALYGGVELMNKTPPPTRELSPVQQPFTPAPIERVPLPESPSEEQQEILPMSTPHFMYHEIGEPESRYVISPQRLEENLSFLYERHIPLQTVDEYVNRYVPGGAVLTFDDSHESQFRFLPDGGIDPFCAVGVLERFKTTHPDYRVTATFFVNTINQGGETMFGQPDLESRKLQFLVDNGYEIGSHGSHHVDFAKLSPRQIVQNLHEFSNQMNAWLPNYPISSFAWPYGSIPSEEHQEIVRGFFRIQSAAWGGLARSGTGNIPRIEVNPTTNLARYVPRDARGNVYKALVARTTYAGRNPQLQTWQTHADDEPDDRLRGRDYHVRESQSARGEESLILNGQEGDLRRDPLNPR